MDTCVTCKYTLNKEGGSLSCCRFPRQVRVARDYVCGEWRPDVKKEKTNGTAQKSTGK
jgi:hypothetical protein